MFRVIRIQRENLFSSGQALLFPQKINVLAHISKFDADVDVIIGTHNQAEEINQTIQNYLALEKQLRLRIWIIESSKNLSAFLKIHRSPQINKILILDHLHATDSANKNRFWASNGAALAAAIGYYLGSARYIFFSHTDMMGYKPDFISFLASKLNAHTPIASFTQRFILPFTGGMLYDREYFQGNWVDWLPKNTNPYSTTWLNDLKEKFEILNWLDAGEQLIYETLLRGKTAYVCASRGVSGDFWGHPLDAYNMDLVRLHPGIHYAQEVISKEEFIERYPELICGDSAMWRKSFDDHGNVIFIHRGRGTSRGGKNDGRGDFLSFIKKFNHALNIVDKGI
jgi:hypothetical protein